MRFSTILIGALALFASVAFALPTPSHLRLSARNAGLEAGTYFILNKVHDSSNAQLAVTSNGQGQTATVTPFSDSSDAQKWAISDNPGTTAQSLSPVSDSTLQAAWGSDGVKLLVGGGSTYEWIIRPSHDNGYVIQDGGKTVYWGIDSGADNAQVTIGAGNDSDQQQWFLQKV
jgi:hypothetical protein